MLFFNIVTFEIESLDPAILQHLDPTRKGFAADLQHLDFDSLVEMKSFFLEPLFTIWKQIVFAEGLERRIP